LETTLTVSKQLEIEEYIKKLNKKIEGYRKKQVQGYQKTVEEIYPKLRKLQSAD
jgi:hypothetical protein